MSKNDIINGIISNFNTTEEDAKPLQKWQISMFETGGIANRSHKIKTTQVDTTITDDTNRAAI